MNDPEIASSERLAAALRAKEPDALAALFDAYADRLFRYCWFLLRNRDIAHIALRDTLVVAEAHIGRLADPRTLPSWLYALARAECRRRRPVPAAQADEPPARPSQSDADSRLMAWNAVTSMDAAEIEVLDLASRHDVDLGLVLGISSFDARVMLDQARRDLERALGAEILVSRGSHACPDRAEMMRGWAGMVTPELRERVLRHAVACPVCGPALPRNVSAARVFALLPVISLPSDARSRVLSFAADYQTAAYREFAVARAAELGESGFPLAAAPGPGAGRARPGRNQPGKARTTEASRGTSATTADAASDGMGVEAAKARGAGERRAEGQRADRGGARAADGAAGALGAARPGAAGPRAGGLGAGRQGAAGGRAGGLEGGRQGATGWRAGVPRGRVLAAVAGVAAAVAVASVIVLGGPAGTRSFGRGSQPAVGGTGPSAPRRAGAGAIGALPVGTRPTQAPTALPPVPRATASTGVALFTTLTKALPGGAPQPGPPPVPPQVPGGPVSAPAPSAKPTTAGTLVVTPGTLDVGPGSQGQVVLTAQGGPDIWTAGTSTGEVSISAYGGSLQAGQSFTLLVTINRTGDGPGNALVYLDQGTPAAQTIKVFWSGTWPRPTPSPSPSPSSSPAPSPSPSPSGSSGSSPPGPSASSPVPPPRRTPPPRWSPSPPSAPAPSPSPTPSVTAAPSTSAATQKPVSRMLTGR
jgi:DNA-directed RNA polymerase specialized sigma24 family protein